MRVEQEQKVTEDARRFAEQDAAAQRYAAQVLQVKKFALTPTNTYVARLFSFEEFLLSLAIVVTRLRRSRIRH